MMLQLENVEKTCEWEYALRRKMQQILPSVYLGPFSAAKKSQFEELQDHGITHIICIRHQLEARFIYPNFPETFKYYVLDITDDSCTNIIPYFSTTYAFIEDALQNSGKVLVHGNNGISRSAAIVIAFIMVKYQTSFQDAYSWVKDRRCCIMPNAGFLQQLKEYEPIYKANLSSFQMVANQNPSSSMKRQYEE